MLGQLLSSTDRIERRLLILASAFMGFYSVALTLSDAVRLRTWQVDYRWQHWIGFVVWMGFTWLTHYLLSRVLPDHDPFIFPIASFLAGWGLLTIWRLSTGLGLRQTVWLAVIGLASYLTLRTKNSFTGNRILGYLRRYKYIWLTSGLLLTAATLFLGTNPMGAGPRLWLGCCGFYFQPSEPLKLLLVVYLAAYLADRQAAAAPPRLIKTLNPTLVMTGLALLLLIFQRDLGTAAIFVALYAVIVYAGIGDTRVLISSTLMLLLAGVVGYALFDVVSQRVDAWINPWIDPSGRSFQVVQSLLAIANGGLIGRGPGIGSPGLVPIAQSDFIFSAISEESGLLGVIALISLLAIFVNRGIRIAMHAEDAFYRLLATGLVVHLVGQSILIIAGNLRLLPLTGVTLPFVSYGGSSLVVSFFELLCLLLISNRKEQVPILSPEKIKLQRRTSLFTSGSLLFGLASLALATGWWTLVRGSDLLTRTDNPRRSISDRYVLRGSILDQHEQPLAESSGKPGEIVRQYPYPALGPIVGYTHPVYGQAGLEASLDPYLRGLQGYPGLRLWWEHMLYGTPPPGLDVRLSLDLSLQSKADELLSGDPGAIVLLNAQSGEILAIASSPTFDANQLDSSWESLISDPTAPLFDRAGMGLYPPVNSLAAFLLASSPRLASVIVGESDPGECAAAPANSSLAALVRAGCPAAINYLLKPLSDEEIIKLLDQLGFYAPPVFPIETLSSAKPSSIANPSSYISGLGSTVDDEELKVSPLQMALAAAALSSTGNEPSPRLAMAYQAPNGSWVMMPGSSQPRLVFDAQAAKEAANALAIPDLPVWEVVSHVKAKAENSASVPQGYSWYLGGTLPSWRGAPLAIAVLLEADDASRVLGIGHAMLQASMVP